MDLILGGLVPGNFASACSWAARPVSNPYPLGRPNPDPGTWHQCGAAAARLGFRPAGRLEGHHRGSTPAGGSGRRLAPPPPRVQHADWRARRNSTLTSAGPTAAARLHAGPRPGDPRATGAAGAANSHDAAAAAGTAETPPGGLGTGAAGAANSHDAAAAAGDSHAKKRSDHTGVSLATGAEVTHADGDSVSCCRGPTDIGCAGLQRHQSCKGIQNPTHDISTSIMDAIAADLGTPITIVNISALR
ncbi:hypothetical protein PLESTB_001790800 [Pleodorina starrii]|uniref:Uncharacterized protein n=1 Tax=Pleodorina starrii TaxID=330485 RepID=A0A9W6C0L2_9CHLO|nr:hypothetical protein PLESTB_001790800 [Pleodorina starrii]GLC76496.1 hypothetical protein PLESTF_001789100 [Pleodorina starrii]